MINFLQGPTMANPEVLDTVQELRDALRQANDALMDQFTQISKLDDAGKRLFAVIYDALKAHVANDSHELNATLEQILLNLPRLREQIEEDIESASIRRAH